MSRPRVVAAVVALALLASAVGSRAETAPRWWVELPRSSGGPELSGLPYPPEPSARALSRRALKGRPDRVAELSRGPDPAALEAVVRTGARVVHVSRWLSAVSVEADAATLVRLRQLERARLRGPVATGRRTIPTPEAQRATAVVDSSAYGTAFDQIAQIGLDRLHAHNAYGRGVRVLVLDTGFDRSHPALAGVDVVDEWDFVFSDPVTADEPADVPNQDRHGTGVLGVLAAFAPGQMIGGAPRVEVLLAKTERLAEEVRAEEDAYVAALEWGEALGADVATASLGYLDFPDSPDSFRYQPFELDGDTAVTTRAVDDLVALGVVAVASMGNRGATPSSLMTPADADSVIAVGSVRATGEVSSFSSRGPTADGRIKPEVCARGTQTTWTVAGGYATASGTSLAAPLVAAAAALVVELHPTLGPGRVREMLLQTAVRSGPPDNDLGWGVARADAAALGLVDPVHPLPFDLVSPDGGTALFGSAAVFRWRRAVDLQTPTELSYRIEFAVDRRFAAVDASFLAGSDTVRALSFLPVGSRWWRVVARDPQGHERTSEVRRVELQLSTDAPASAAVARLGRIWPNPANPQVTVEVLVDGRARVELAVFDLRGRRVRRLLEGPVDGPRVVRWDGLDERGRPAGSGAYRLRLAWSGPGGRQGEQVRGVVLVR